MCAPSKIIKLNRPIELCERSFMNDNVNQFTQGNRFMIRNMEPERAEEVKAQLLAAGWTQSYSMKFADFIVIDGEPDQKLIASAQRFSVSLIQADEALEISDLSEVSELDEEFGKTLEKKSAIEVTDAYVRILDMKLPRRDPLTIKGIKPEPISNFSHLCLDQNFLITARNVVMAAHYDIPCVLEGETATAKTTVIKWLAALTGQPLYRINLNGQTDTAELVGRFVPASGYEEIDTDILLKHIGEFDQDPEWERVKQDLIEVRESIAQGRPRELNPIEKARIAKTLGLAMKTWTFVEGLIPSAMRHGVWVILDEMNLAEPQILERLNSVLETEHTLVLTEGDNTTFGPGGDVEVHSDFRIFGTMNPAEYTGRNSLSPAFRDRWSLWNFVDLPGESELHAMLRCLVFGEQPEFEFKGVLYRAAPTQPSFPNLQAVPDIDEILRRLAIFHHTLAVSSGNGGGQKAATLGRTRRERYQFTRRGLHSLMKLFSHTIAHLTSGQDRDLGPTEVNAQLNEILELLYVSKVQSSVDRRAIVSAMRAAGLAQ